MKKFLLTIAVAGSCLSVQALPTQWTSGTGANGHWYEVVSIAGAALSWDAANTAATGSSYLGATGYLATIADVNENTFIFSLVGQTTAWLGGVSATSTSAAPTIGWAWANGDTWTGYTDWAGVQPDAWLNLSPQYLVSYQGAWGDAHSEWGSDGNVAHYVVEYNSVPDGGITLMLLGIGIAGLAIVRRKLT